MPSHVVKATVPANGTFLPLSGAQYEYLPWPSLVEFGFLADAAGVLATVYSGSDLLAEEGPVDVGTINTLPQYPFQFHYADEAAGGDRLKVTLRDTSGAVRTVMCVIRITPL
jgi:hypothetical protein